MRLLLVRSTCLSTELCLRAPASALAPASPIRLPRKSSVVTALDGGSEGELEDEADDDLCGDLEDRASAIATAPASPSVLSERSRVLRAVFDARAVAKAAAPSGPIPLPLIPTKRGNISRVGIFLDLVWLTTRAIDAPPWGVRAESQTKSD